MEIEPGSEFIVELDDVDSRFATSEEVKEFIKTIQAKPVGHLTLLIDYGPMPWWDRLLGSQRNIGCCFSVEWAVEYASLIFHDEAWSEYRVLDHQCPVEASDDIRRHLAHGDVTPHAAAECMSKPRAFLAIVEFLETGMRPEWLSYRYVA